MKNSIHIKIFISLISLILVTSCGYHLRGSQQAKLNIKNIYLDYSNINLDTTNDRFVHLLANNLRSQNIEVMTSSDNATNSSYTYRLEILNGLFNKNIISTSSSKLISQYKITFYTKFNLYQNNTKVLSDQVINTQRNYNYTQDQILGLDSEETTISNEILQETIDRIINQIILTIK